MNGLRNTPNGLAMVRLLGDEHNGRMLTTVRVVEGEYWLTTPMRMEIVCGELWATAYRAALLGVSTSTVSRYRRRGEAD